MTYYNAGYCFDLYMDSIDLVTQDRIDITDILMDRSSTKTIQGNPGERGIALELERRKLLFRSTARGEKRQYFPDHIGENKRMRITLEEGRVYLSAWEESERIRWDGPVHLIGLCEYGPCEEMESCRERDLRQGRMEGQCKYDMAHREGCLKDSLPGQEVCAGHQGVQCIVCGEQAYAECWDTGMLVCGRPLCGKDECREQHDKVHNRR